MTARRVNLSTKDKEKFKRFLRTLERKTWREVLDLIDVEYQSLIGSDQKKYCARLIKLASYLRYPTEQMPKEYRPLLLTMVRLPDLLTEKLAETFHSPESAED
jgi:hypothetical protein